MSDLPSLQAGRGREHSGTSSYRRIVVLLVHPSNYDHPGRGVSFVQTYARGVIPSNSLRVLRSLTEEVLAEAAFAGVEREVHAFEDGIRSDQRRFNRALLRSREEGTLLVVGLVGVQTNQFPRSCDLIERARAHGAHCVIGGPHVTAAVNTMLHGISTVDPMRPGVACPGVMPPEIQRLIETPEVTVFHGDADSGGAWRAVLSGLLHGEQAPRYIEAGLAEELGGPGGVYSARELDAFATPVAAVDTERGCPFKCKFCAAIQAHGRTIRSRPVGEVVQWVRRQCDSYGKPLTVLFASDNLARNPHWRELLAGLRRLREEGYRFKIWAEADVRCDDGPNAGFLEEYAKAGGEGLFFGIESMNPENLTSAGKAQNNVSHLAGLFERCRRYGIAPEGGYIIGMANDTVESIKADVQRLADAGMARAWFFIRTMLPGSQDWVEAYTSGYPMSADLNEYDSSVVSCAHDRMEPAEWQGAYDVAVRTFYSGRNMVKILARHAPFRQRWRLAKSFIWYRWSHFAERTHPMIAGLYRHRPFSERRPGAAYGRIHHCWSEVVRHARYLLLAVRELAILGRTVGESELRVALRRQRRPAAEESPAGDSRTREPSA